MKHGNNGPDPVGSGSDLQHWLRGKVSFETGYKIVLAKWPYILGHDLT
jgi:hypothetical protein